MLLGIGTDLVEARRVARSVRENAGFREAVFSARETSSCEASSDPALAYAVRFAAKEAFLKAAGLGWPAGPPLSQIEVLEDRLGRPSLRLRGRAKRLWGRRGLRLHLSLSRARGLAGALVAIETAG
ncbi:MAG: holo-ACP synthase [Elusimicrobiota bacterium]